ncbi:carboxypeptidase-like regulatory domain-containing protein, partial [Flavihumibacter sediminis]|nr:carboxypeptidase-like regulatory domain-containing protein [Flavihumibacter sediminis]
PPVGKSTETELVTISLQGRITDQQAAPVAGAVVRSGNHVTTTDINGNYRFSSIQVKPNSGLVEVSVNGFFREYKGFEVMPETEHYVRMQLEPLNSGIRFAAASGGSYTLPSGSGIEFGPDAMAEAANGQQYAGTVQV